MNASPRAEGELLFLTDSAYLSLIDEQPTRSSNGAQKHDGLFLERLDSFIEGQMRDMAAFADREQHPFDEIHKLVAIHHAKFLFSTENNLANDDLSTPSVRGTLARLSSNLQTLHSTAGIHSLMLAVAPAPPSSTATVAEGSWIGGTELGKDFWMGLKAGGVAGMRTFRAKCHSAEASAPKQRSGDVKAELNAAVRKALRTASGNPSAEMRWTRPAALEDSYGVRLCGWPADLARRNPSNNTLRENWRLLECIRSGSMRFVSRGSLEWAEAGLELGAGPVTEGSRGDDGRVLAPVLESSSASGTPRPSNDPAYAASALHAEASLTHPGLVENAKRSAESEDSQDRRTRRRIDDDIG